MRINLRPTIIVLSLICSITFVFLAVSLYKQDIALHALCAIITAGILAVFPWVSRSKAGSNLLLVAIILMMMQYCYLGSNS